MPVYNTGTGTLIFKIPVQYWYYGILSSTGISHPYFTRASMEPVRAWGAYAPVCNTVTDTYTVCHV